MLVFFSVMFAQAVNNPVTEVTGTGRRGDYNVGNLYFASIWKERQTA